ncbi:uncharacterized protein METZ01_LOCUS512282, partial [marine metagenome]
MGIFSLAIRVIPLVKDEIESSFLISKLSQFVL